MMQPINRSAVIIAPKQSFFTMLKEISGKLDEQAGDPLDEDESTIYLLPEAELDDPDLEGRLARHYRDIFYEELEGWFTDRERWPKISPGGNSNHGFTYLSSQW